MQRDLAFILGALEDASLIQRKVKGEYLVEFEQKNRKWLEIIAECFEKCFGLKPVIKQRKRGYFRVRVYSKSVFHTLIKERKRFLERWQTYSQNTWKEFLRGVFDSEGSVIATRKVISIGSTDKELLKICREMLQSLGIECGKITKSHKNVKKFCIYGKNNLKKFQKVVGFSHPEKAKN